MQDDIEKKVANVLASFTIDELRQLVSEMEVVMQRPEERVFEALLPLLNIASGRPPAMIAALG